MHPQAGAAFPEPHAPNKREKENKKEKNEENKKKKKNYVLVDVNKKRAAG